MSRFTLSTLLTVVLCLFCSSGWAKSDSDDKDKTEKCSTRLEIIQKEKKSVQNCAETIKGAVDTKSDDFIKFMDYDPEKFKINTGEFYRKQGDLSTNKKFIKCRRKAYNVLCDLSGALDSDDFTTTCKESGTKLNEAISEYEGACGAIRMGSTTTCLSNMRSCSACDADGNFSDSYNDIDCKVADSTDAADLAEAFNAPMRNALSGNNIPTPQNVSPRYGACPIAAGVDLNDLKDEVKDLRKDLLGNQEKMLSFEEEKDQLDAEYQRRRKELLERIEELHQEAEDREQAIMAALKEGQNATYTLVAQLRRQINDLNAMIDVEYQKMDVAFVDYQDAKAQLNIQCHAAALQRINALVEEKRQMIAGSIFTAGGFNSLMKSAGTSSKDEFRKKARGYFRDCMKDQAYKENLKSLKRRKAFVARTAKKNVARLRKQIAEITRTIQDTLNSTPGQAQEAWKAVEKMYRRITSKILKITGDPGASPPRVGEIALLDDQYNKQIDKQNKRKQLAQQEYFYDASYMMQKESMLRKRDGIVGQFGGQDIGAEGLSDAMAKYGKLKVNTMDTLSTCGCCGKDAKGSSCSSARSYVGTLDLNADILCDGYDGEHGELWEGTTKGAK